MPAQTAALSLSTCLDNVNRLTLERLAADLCFILDEYKHNLPVARFQTLKSLLYQHQTARIFTDDGIYFLLLQILSQCSSLSPMMMPTFDQILIAHYSTLPILVRTSTVSNTVDQQSIKTLAENLFDSSSLPIFHDLASLETISCRYLANHVLQFAMSDLDDSLPMQRVKLLELFWSRIPSLRHLQITDDNECFLFLVYYLMRRVTHADSSM
jgi:hypothetical protein